MPEVSSRPDLTPTAADRRATFQRAVRTLGSLWVAGITLAFATGCDNVADRLADAQARVNRALPPSVEVTALGAAVAEAADAVPGRRARIEAEMADFRKRRALECAKGLVPSWRDSTAELRAQLNDVTCFAAQDADMLVWLRRMQVGTQLLLPAEPLDATPRTTSLVLDERVEGVRLPQRGPIAMLVHPRGWSLVDLRTGSRIRSGQDASGVLSPHRPSLSANGQVAYMVTEQGQLRLEDVKSARLLEDLGASGVTYFSWVGETLAIINSAKPGRSLLVDYKTGRHAELPRDDFGFYGGALPTPAAGEFMLVGRQHLRLVRIDSTDTALAITALRDVSLQDVGVNPAASAISSDGRRFLAVLGQMALIDLGSGESTSVGLWPGFVFSAWPHAEPHKFFLRTTGEGQSLATFVFDAVDQTVARVSDAGDGRMTWQYWPAMKKYVNSSGTALRIVDAPPPTEAAEPLAELFARRLQAENERKLAAVAPQGAPNAFRAPTVALPVGARVLGVGAYESKTGSHGFGRPRVAGPIDVTVMRTSYPVVLVLTSYEPVNWRIQLAPGARLGAVLLFGYYESSVVGHGDAKVHRGGRFYAYQRPSGEFDRLNREVISLTGQEINGFQGAYSTATFSVGSW